MKLTRKIGIASVVLALVWLGLGVLLGRYREGHQAEHPPISDIRSVISAEAAYAGSNGDFYGPLSCLEKPETCLPGYKGPVFLDANTASLATKSGYVRRFHPGPSLSAEEAARAKTSPSSIRGFAYVAVPEKVGVTGVRAFCGDDRGVICFTRTGVMPEIKDGRCPAECETLQ